MLLPPTQEAVIRLPLPVVGRVRAAKKHAGFRRAKGKPEKFHLLNRLKCRNSSRMLKFGRPEINLLSPMASPRKSRIPYTFRCTSQNKWNRKEKPRLWR
jgi:hypothetical protein